MIIFRLSRRTVVVMTGIGVLVVLACFILFLLQQRQSSAVTLQSVKKLSHHDYQTAQDTLTQRLKQSGLGATFSDVRRQIQVNPSFARDCHPLLHHLGRAAYKELGDFAVAMGQADEICNSGFVHGLIEANFAAASTVDEAIAKSCPSTSAQTFRQWQCYHGVGHGIMYATQKDHVKSIAKCEQLPTRFATASCVNGVFMERFIIVSHAGEMNEQSAVGDITLCRSQKSAYKADCYIYAPTAYLEQHVNKYSDAAKWCHQAEADFIGTCVMGVGSQAMKENIVQPRLSAGLCAQLSDGQYRAQCAYGAISIYINHYGSADKAAPLCVNEFRDFRRQCETIIHDKKVTLQI